MTRLKPQSLDLENQSNVSQKINNGDYLYVKLNNILKNKKSVSQISITVKSLTGGEVKVYLTDSQGDDTWIQETDSTGNNPFTESGVRKIIYDVSANGLKVEASGGDAEVLITLV